MIPFYGSDQPDLFLIERAAMDRAGYVIQHIDHLLPEAGTVLDVGAGDGFTAQQLTTDRRNVVALEPAGGMIDTSRDLAWVQGLAQELPFAAGSLDGLYATWAYFFPKHHDVRPGLDEADRVVKPGGPIIVVDNLGDDEFTAPASHDITTDAHYWEADGFRATVVDTAFAFDSIEDARLLMAMFFGEAGRAAARTTLSFRAGVFSRPSRGPA